MRRIVLLALALGPAGCMYPHPPPPPPPPELGTAGLSLDPAFVDKFLGTYRSGSDVLSVRRAGTGVFAQRSGEPAYALTRTSERAFVDTRGVAYIFTLPPDGNGAMLQMVYADGKVRVWNRSP